MPRRKRASLSRLYVSISRDPYMERMIIGRSATRQASRSCKAGAALKRSGSSTSSAPQEPGERDRWGAHRRWRQPERRPVTAAIARRRGCLPCTRWPRRNSPGAASPSSAKAPRTKPVAGSPRASASSRRWLPRVTVPRANFMEAARFAAARQVRRGPGVSA